MCKYHNKGYHRNGVMVQKRLNLGEKLYKSKNVTFAFFNGHSLISHEMEPLHLMQSWRLSTHELLQVGCVIIRGTLWNIGCIEVMEKYEIQYFIHYVQTWDVMRFSTVMFLIALL